MFTEKKQEGERSGVTKGGREDAVLTNEALDSCTMLVERKKLTRGISVKTWK
jgi:hypothetical protein